MRVQKEIDGVARTNYPKNIVVSVFDFLSLPNLKRRNQHRKSTSNNVHASTSIYQKIRNATLYKILTDIICRHRSDHGTRVSYHNQPEHDLHSNLDDHGNVDVREIQTILMIAHVANHIRWQQFMSTALYRFHSRSSQ